MNTQLVAEIAEKNKNIKKTTDSVKFIKTKRDQYEKQKKYYEKVLEELETKQSGKSEEAERGELKVPKIYIYFSQFKNFSQKYIHIEFFINKNNSLLNVCIILLL